MKFRTAIAAAIALAGLATSSLAAAPPELIYLDCTTDKGGRMQLFVDSSRKRMGQVNVSSLPLQTSETHFRAEQRSENPPASLTIQINRYTLEAVVTVDPPWPGVPPTVHAKCELQQRKL